MSLDLAALSDGELAALSLAGRDQAFTELMRRHREAIYRIALGNVGDPDEALDLTQETFVSAYQALRRYDAARPLRAWLARIAINKCRDWRRRRAVRRMFAFAVPVEDVIEVLPDHGPTPHEQASDRQELAMLRRAVAALPRSLREPLVLHTLDGMSQAETASVLGLPKKRSKRGCDAQEQSFRSYGNSKSVLSTTLPGRLPPAGTRCDCGSAAIDARAPPSKLRNRRRRASALRHEEVMDHLIDRRGLLRGAALVGGGIAVSTFMPAWAQRVSSGIASPLSTVSGDEISLTIAQQTMMIDGRPSRAIGMNGTVPRTPYPASRRPPRSHPPDEQPRRG